MNIQPAVYAIHNFIVVYVFISLSQKEMIRFLAEHPPVQVEVAEKQPSYQYWKEQFSHAQQSANQAQEEVEWLRRQVERWSL